MLVIRKTTKVNSNKYNSINNNSGAFKPNFIKNKNNSSREKVTEITKSNEELILEMRNGCPNAREAIINKNLRMVVSIAKKFANVTNHPLVDLISEGNIGFMNAIDRFDEKKSTNLSTYAYIYIKESIERFSYEQAGNVRIPIKAKKKKIQNNEKTGEISIDESVDLGFDTIDDSADTEKEVLLGKTKEMLETLVCALDDFSAKILIHRYGLFSNTPKTLEDVGSIMGVSREVIRKTEKKSLHNLKTHMNAQNLSLDIVI